MSLTDVPGNRVVPHVGPLEACTSLQASGEGSDRDPQPVWAFSFPRERSYVLTITSIVGYLSHNDHGSRRGVYELLDRQESHWSPSLLHPLPWEEARDWWLEQTQEEPEPETGRRSSMQVNPSTLKAVPVSAEGRICSRRVTPHRSRSHRRRGKHEARWARWSCCMDRGHVTDTDDRRACERKGRRADGPHPLDSGQEDSPIRV